MRRPDASMTLLSDLQKEALEPEYRNPNNRGRSPLRLGLALGLAMLLLTVAVLQTTRGAGVAQEQRAELLDRLTTAREQQATLAAQAAALEDEVRALGEGALADEQQRARLQELELASGAAAVTGPGIVVVVGDAPDATSSQGFVLDGDLRRLVNGLREAGAEAIAVNGHRLTTLTPIRSAGAAITVDFVSLSPPYTVEAIGNPRTLEARFNETSAAVWWQHVVGTYGLTMTISSREELNLPPDTGMNTRNAEVG